MIKHTLQKQYKAYTKETDKPLAFNDWLNLRATESKHNAIVADLYKLGRAS
jgi:hypothetical protein